MTIRVTVVDPPTSDDCRWAAVRDNYVPGDAVGHGPTPGDAIYDLMMVEQHSATDDYVAVIMASYPSFPPMLEFI